ncbi:MAG: SpoIVB peptidase [Epulopiscium sp. Nele67-Bin004]|nr:MAG: SpoIVB peptidase [Epulopiscium sp. Nele67-Bin004]
MIIFTILSPIIVTYYYLPNEIKVVVGREYSINFEVPIWAKLNISDDLLIADNESILVGAQKVKLNDPLVVEAQHEGQTDLEISLLGAIPVKTVQVQAMPYTEVIPGGQVIGIEVHSDGVCVVGTGGFLSNDEMVDPCKSKIKKGDIITSVDGKEVITKEDFKEYVEDNNGETITVGITRGKKHLEVEITPAFSDEEDAYKIGAWIKDTIQGLGTLTYIDPETGNFGALGHGITDAEFEKLIPIDNGTIMSAKIDGITKGEAGNPGEISGIINTGDHARLGEIDYNTARGIFGVIEQEDIYDLSNTAIPIACQNEVKEGSATILASLTDEGIMSYNIEIQKVAKYSTEPSKGMIIKIVDERLLELTQGIVQGMSGSPIIQDGKLIGAISHVFVNDPTTGYGIFIENMIETVHNLQY